jgi:hypothetical protein
MRHLLLVASLLLLATPAAADCETTTHSAGRIDEAAQECRDSLIADGARIAWSAEASDCGLDAPRETRGTAIGRDEFRADVRDKGLRKACDDEHNRVAAAFKGAMEGP